MNEFVKNLNEHVVANYNKAFSLLDNVLNKTVEAFADVDVLYDNSKKCFVVEHLKQSTYSLIVNINYDDSPSINATVKFNEFVVANCGMGINGEFEERYSRFPDADMKMVVSEYFTSLSSIDINNMSDENAVEQPDNLMAVDNEEPIIEEAPEVEVVTE